MKKSKINSGELTDKYPIMLENFQKMSKRLKTEILMASEASRWTA